MAAIIEPRTHHHGATSFQTSRRPRHLSTVAALPTSDATVRGPVPVQVSLPAEPLLTPSTIAAMVAAVVIAALLALGVGVGAFSALVPTPGTEQMSTSEGRVVVVEPGDSVWSIARSIQPDGDVRPLVHRIVQANGAAPLQPGQQLMVPV